MKIRGPPLCTRRVSELAARKNHLVQGVSHDKTMFIQYLRRWTLDGARTSWSGSGHYAAGTQARREELLTYPMTLNALAQNWSATQQSEPIIFLTESDGVQSEFVVQLVMVEVDHDHLDSNQGANHACSGLSETLLLAFSSLQFESVSHEKRERVAASSC